MTFALLDGPVHALNPVVGPGVVHLNQPVIDLMFAADAVTPVSFAMVIKKVRFNAPLSLKAASNFDIWPSIAGGCGQLFDPAAHNRSVRLSLRDQASASASVLSKARS